MFQPDPEPSRTVVVVAAAHDHSAQGDVAAAFGHQALQARQVLLCRCPRQIADNLAVNLHGDSVRVIRVRRFRNEYCHDLAANPVSGRPARQTPQGVLICEFANYLKIILPAQY